MSLGKSVCALRLDEQSLRRVFENSVMKRRGQFFDTSIWRLRIVLANSYFVVVHVLIHDLMT